MGEHPPVVLATPAWSLNGPNVFSLGLVRGLRARGIPAHLLVTRPDWVDAKPLPPPEDLPLEFLPVQPFLTLRARWKAMLDYLESRAPCIYIPNYDFGHSCISPRLSDRVAIVGIVHSDDPQHYEHVTRLGKYWNAIVAVSPAIAEETRRLAPAMGDRLVVIPYGVRAAAKFPEDRAREARCLGDDSEALPKRVETSKDEPARRTTDDESRSKRGIWSAPETRRDESRRGRDESLRHDYRGSLGLARRDLAASSACAALRVIYAGRLDQPQKRVLDLPPIVKAAQELGVPIRLSVAGSGPAEAQLRESCVTAGIQAEFLGTLDEDALARELERHDAFLLTSSFEGLPIGMLEAMGRGCVPVISDLRSGVREVVRDGENGFRVAVGDIAAFARRLAELYADPAMRQRMGEAAWRTIRDGPYHVDAMVQRYVDLFARVLEEVRCGGFQRPQGPILPPPRLPWTEHLSQPLQRVGHIGKRLLTRTKG